MSDFGSVVFEEETAEWDEDAVFSLCWARATMTDEEWAADTHSWDISREEAATRIAEEDWSSPDREDDNLAEMYEPDEFEDEPPVE